MTVVINKRLSQYHRQPEPARWQTCLSKARQTQFENQRDTGTASC